MEERSGKGHNLWADQQFVFLSLLFSRIKKVTNLACRQAGKSRQISIPPFLLKEKAEPKVQADFDAVRVSG